MLFRSANSVTNVMRRLSQTEEAEKQDPFSVSHNDTNALYDDEYSKKMFIVNAKKSVYDFINYVKGSLRESGFFNNPSVWQAILEMISLSYTPDMLNVNNQKALDVLNDIWTKFEELRKETVQLAPISETVNGLPMANEEANKKMFEQFSTLTGMVLVGLKQQMREFARMDADYMPNKDLVNEHTEPAYTTKYNPDNIEKQ